MIVEPGIPECYYVLGNVLEHIHQVYIRMYIRIRTYEEIDTNHPLAYPLLRVECITCIITSNLCIVTKILTGHNVQFTPVWVQCNQCGSITIFIDSAVFCL